MSWSNVVRGQTNIGTACCMSEPHPLCGQGVVKGAAKRSGQKERPKGVVNLQRAKRAKRFDPLLTTPWPHEEWSKGVVQKEWSKRSGQKGVVKKEWSKRSGPKGVVKKEWSKRSGQPPLLQEGSKVGRRRPAAVKAWSKRFDHCSKVVKAHRKRRSRVARGAVGREVGRAGGG